MTSNYTEISETHMGDASVDVAVNTNYTSLATDEITSEKVARKDLYLRHTQRLKSQVRKHVLALQRWETYTEQAPIRDAIDKLHLYMEKMIAIQSIIVPERFFFHIEGFISLYFAAIKCKDVSQAIAIVSLYCQRYYTQSITTLVVDTLCKISVENQAGSSTNWLDLLRDAKTNWKLVLANEGFAGISKVLSIMLSLGLCDSSQLNYTMAGMKMFSITATKKQACAIDLIDAVFETIIYFVEGGYQCFMTGSVTPLLIGDFDMVDIEKRVALCEQNAAFARTGDLEKRAGISVTDFDSELRAVIDKLVLMHQSASNEFLKRLLREKLDKLRKVQTHFFQTRVQGGLREAPYGMSFYGTSGVGKSCISNILMIVVLAFNGYCASDDRIMTINDKDTFMSTMMSNINGIHYDDVGNTKLEYVEVAPSSRVIELINNVRAYANMAELEMKGKVSIEPKVVNFTSNSKTLCAEQFSNEPASITRRAQFTCTVKVKDRFAKNGMLNYDLVKSFYGDEIPIIPDLWDLTVERSFPIPNPTPGRPDLIGWEIYTYNDPVLGPIYMKDVGISWLIKFANWQSERYFAQQRDFVEKSNNLSAKMKFCENCRFPGCMCECVPIVAPCSSDTESETSDEESINSEITDQAGSYLYWSLCYVNRRYFRGWDKKFNEYLSYFEKYTTDMAISRFEELMHSPYSSWTNWIPAQWLYNEQLCQTILLNHEDEIRKRVISAYFLSGCSAFFGFLDLFFGYGILSLLLIPLAIYISYNVIETEKARLLAKIREENGSMPAIFRKYRDSYITYICGASAVIALLYIVVQAWKFSRWVTVEEQGNLTPTSIEDVEVRDQEAEVEEEIRVEHNWTGVKVEPIPCQREADTTTLDQLEKKVRNNLAFLKYTRNNKIYACDIFFVKSNVALVPKHMWMDDDMQVDILFKSPNCIGPNFRAMMSRTYSVDIPNHDLSLVWIPNGGCRANLLNYFPMGKMRNCPALLVHKKLVQDNLLDLSSQTMLKFNNVGNASSQFYGAEYVLEFDTFVGLCMAVLISKTKETVIAGFHLGGISGKPNGVCGTPTLQEVSKAINSLEQIEGVIIATSEGVMPTKLYEVQILQSTTLHPKSPVNNVPPDAHIEVYGSCIGRATYYSDVIDSPIQKSVEDICGVTNTFGKPKFHLGNAWNASLQVSCRPSIGVEGYLLHRAIRDYVDHLIKKISSIPELRKYIRPLTRMETICGIDGVRFIDKIPPNTSIGAPLSGPKSKYITLLDPEEFPDFACPAELDEKFWDYFMFCRGEFLAQRRVYLMFKACLKDEPTNITKDKVRVFQAAPIVLQLFVRMYFLPIVRLLSIFPLDSECGVGINTVGPEFHALAEYMRKFGANRILAGDYSKYDLRMPAQLIFAAFDCLIQIAKYFGYSSDDITIMRSVATEVAYPLMMYNGDLIQHYGSNPSGQNLTVYINSIVNSLLMRCCYFSIYPEGKSFREVAAMMTYGDDVKGSVSTEADDFNHLSYAAWLKEHDILFTMPDKTSVPTKYMKDEEADFLKRHNVWNSELRLWQGALDEKSIFKSLMCNLRSKVLTPEEVASQNIDGALREWWLHGREMYELRRFQMQKVAAQHNLQMNCQLLTKDYNWMMSSYCDRYQLDYPESLSRNDVKSVPPSADTCL